MDLSREQEDALQSVKRWMERGGEGVYRLFGFAGTGKTTIAKLFAQGCSNPAYCSFTGKAAHVMQKKGCDGATTIHRLIYKPAEKSKERLEQLKKELEQLVGQLKSEGYTEEQVGQHPEHVKLSAELVAEQTKHKRPSFKLNPDSAIKRADIVIVDECSMVDQQIGEDLLSFNRPVLVLGDPAQLPPVRGSGYFTEQSPDFLLTEIHRQARDNPILRMAHDVREGHSLRPGTYGDSRVITRAEVTKEDVLAADQVLVGLNKTRKATNDRIRELKGRTAGRVEAGDKLVCLRNNHEVGLLNGSIHEVISATEVDSDLVEMEVKDLDTGGQLVVSAHTQYFAGGEPPFWAVREAESFDFGYALTGHKSQGSQFDNVYIFDESWAFRQDRQKWLYTVITRAAKTVTVVV